MFKINDEVDELIKLLTVCTESSMQLTLSALPKT